MNFIIIREKIVSWKNKTKDPTSFHVKVSELQNKIGILEAENKLLKEIAQINKNY